MVRLARTSYVFRWALHRSGRSSGPLGPDASSLPGFPRVGFLAIRTSLVHRHPTIWDGGVQGNRVRSTPTQSWGTALHARREYLKLAPWMSLAPRVAIYATPPERSTLWILARTRDRRPEALRERACRSLDPPGYDIVMP